MPPRKYDWDALIRDFVVEKQKDHTLSNDNFYRMKGLPVPLARKRLGKRLTDAWSKVQAEAAKLATKQAALNLSKEIVDVLKTSKALMAQGANAALGKGVPIGKNGELKVLVPSKYSEAVDAVGVGSKGVIETIKVLTGGDPILPPGAGTDLEEVVRWNDPAERPTRKRRG
jgi:hypothetical protein